MRKFISSFLFLTLLASLLFAFSTPAMADDDPPGRVARLNYIQGSLSFQPGGESDWVQANPNRPLTTGDNLWADKNSRGELHIGSTAIRLSSQTGITFLNLDDRTVQIQLAEGSISAHVRRLEGGDAFEIDMPVKQHVNFLAKFSGANVLIANIRIRNLPLIQNVPNPSNRIRISPRHPHADARNASSVTRNIRH